MRYTKAALLLFGAALLLGLVVKSAEISNIERLAAATIALAILLVPAAVAGDLWRRLRASAAALRKPARKPARNSARRRSAPGRRRPRPRG